MKSQANDTLHMMIWTAAIALLLFCATAFAAVAGWVPFALGYTGEDPASARIEWSRLEAAKPAAPRPALVERRVQARRAPAMASQL
jgi:hypothetical protein